MSNVTTSASAHASGARSTIAPMGLIGRGVTYSLFALIAVNVAFGTDGADTQAGAIAQVAEAPFGKFLLIALAVALVSLVIWKVLQAVSGDPVEGSEPTDRAKYAGKAAIYSGLALTAVSVLIANWSSSSSSGSGSGDTKKQATATVLDWPGGQVLVVLVGLGIIGFAGYEFYKYTIEAEFEKRLDFSGDREAARDVIVHAGRAGYGGKSIVTAVVGVFFVVAGFQHDSSDAVGLSGALRKLAGEAWGQLLLIVIAVGLALFAGFSFAESKYRRAT